MSLAVILSLVLTLAAAPPPPPPPPPSPPTIAVHSLAETSPDAVCVDGTSATVAAPASASAAGGSTTWVIQIGPGNGGAGLFCWHDPTQPSGQLWDCQTAAKPKGTPPPSVNVTALGAAGPQDLNCTRNPDFCTANMAQISTCSLDMLMGDATLSLNGTVVHLKGQAVLEASLKKLATLGLSKATAVLLTGETHAGTAAVLAADRVGALLKTLAPNLKTFKALPADGMHPRFPSMFSVSMPGSDTLWFDKALMQMAALANISAAVNPACAAAHPGNFSYQCLYLSNTAPYISTPLFAVQQMPGVWDSQCLYDGRLRPYLECSSHSTYFRRQYMCVQYPDLCDPSIVQNWTVPLQQQYLTEYLPVHAKPGNGGFFFSCYLGSYWEMLYCELQYKCQLFRFSRLKMQKCSGEYPLKNDFKNFN